MTEYEQAVAYANKVLDRVNADPDDDIAVLARSFLRLDERVNYKPSKLYAETVKVRCCSAISPCAHQRKFPSTVCETCHEAARN